MTLEIKHATQVDPVEWPDDPSAPVGTEEWNAALVATMATARLLGRTTAGNGAVEELTAAAAKTLLALVKGDVGLGNVDNTSDAGKPVSTLQQAALDLKASLAGATFTGAVTLAADPVSALQAATKQYVDGLLANVGKRQRVRVATTANITISTALNNGDVLDGVTLANGDLVLVKNQTTGSQNGVYVVSASPARATEFDSWGEFPGSLIGVYEGTVNGDTLWLNTNNDGGTLGSTAIVFTQLRVAGELLAANNLSDVANAATAFDNIKQPASQTAQGVVELATAAEVRAKAANLALTAEQAFAAAAWVDLGNLSGAVALNFSTFLQAKAALTGNITLNAPTNLPDGVYVLHVTHSGAARTISLNATNWDTPGGAGLTLSTTAGQSDMLTIIKKPGGKALISVSGLNVGA